MRTVTTLRSRFAWSRALAVALRWLAATCFSSLFWRWQRNDDCPAPSFFAKLEPRISSIVSREGHREAGAKQKMRARTLAFSRVGRS